MIGFRLKVQVIGCFVKFCKHKCNTFVLYFDQQMGAVRHICWSKCAILTFGVFHSFFCTFSVPKPSKKRVKRGQKGLLSNPSLHSNAGLTPTLQK